MQLDTSDFGLLHVVATPIGNLEDISSRAVNVLSSVAIIAAEDTRRTLSLLAAIGVNAPRMIALHDHNETVVNETILNALREGRDVALVSDAGTPLLSDPGYTLINTCYEVGVKVLPVPGPSALSCALSVCPLPTAGFQFIGFLPSGSGPRRSRIQGLIEAGNPVVFFEAPHRMRECLIDLAELAPDKRVFVGREMTKRFESYLCGSASSLIETFDDQASWRGEFVCVLEGRARGASAQSLDAERLMRILCAELAPAQAARLGAELLGAKKSELYALAMQLKH